MGKIGRRGVYMIVLGLSATGQDSEAVAAMKSMTL